MAIWASTMYSPIHQEGHDLGHTHQECTCFAFIYSWDWLICTFTRFPFNKDLMAFSYIYRSVLANDIAEKPCAIFVMYLLPNKVAHPIIHDEFLKLLIKASSWIYFDLLHTQADLQIPHRYMYRVFLDSSGMYIPCEFIMMEERIRGLNVIARSGLDNFNPEGVKK